MSVADKGDKTSIDWEAVELQYRAGVRSLKDIGAEFGVSDAGIIKRAKRDGWTRDLAAKIKARADAKVSAAAVSAVVSEQKAANQEAVVEANAELQARIRREHRTDISRSRRVVMSLLDELEMTCGPENAALLAEFGELMREPDERGQDKRADLYSKLLSLGGRAKTMKDLGDSLKSMVALEREAFGIDEKRAPDAQTVFNMQF